jgi:hypothetical protein
MTQWHRRADKKNIEELEDWAETLSLLISKSPEATQNLIVKRRWVLQTIVERREKLSHWPTAGLINEEKRIV